MPASPDQETEVTLRLAISVLRLARCGLLEAALGRTESDLISFWPGHTVITQPGLAGTTYLTWTCR